MAARILPLICLHFAILSCHWIVLITVVNAASLNTSPPASSCFAADLAALRSFAANCASDTITEHWKGDDCCSWEGVFCTSTPTGLNAGAAAPTSSEPAAAARVYMLAVLDVHRFTGPKALLSLCSLSALSVLYLVPSPADLPVNDSVSASAVISIPECIGTNLTNLETLEIVAFGSAITGSIPQSFSRLRSLTDLKLADNGLSGPLPSFLFTGLPNLTILDLSGNSFTGSIPACDAPHLLFLDLSSNAFSGNISDFFSHSNLPSLSYLFIRYNSLSGDIPPFDPSQFSSLQDLLLLENHITGSLPKSLCELTTLQSLSLAVNALTGGIPSQCQTLANLTYLDLSYNRFTGPFPSWVSSLSNLQALDLSYNNFTGRLPDDWHKLSRLSTLGLSGNSLVPLDHPNSSILLPVSLFQLPLRVLHLASMHLQLADLDCGSRLLLLNTTIQDLDLSVNNLSTSVLWCLSTPQNNFTSLSGLNMSRNPLALTLNGVDPVKILLMRQKSLSLLDLSSCELNGSLTHLFTEDMMAPIQALHLANNGLVGEIPPQLGNLSGLAVLDLSNNNFTRFSPFRDHKLPANPIIRLFLSNNKLVGDLSSILLGLYNYHSNHDELHQQCGLKELDLSHNTLTGGLTASLGRCLSLTRLKLNDNFLEGIIPDELFSNIQSIQTLSLSNNQLSGPIPSSIKKHKDLVLLDLSRNSFVGDLQNLFNDDSNGNFANLRVLVLGHNKFTGPIPLSLGNFTPALQVIDLSHNSLVGPIPKTLQQLRAFQRIQDTTITGLSLQGTLYEEFRINVKGDFLTYTYALEVLTSLDLSNNNLTGPIPIGFGVLSSLVYLNLSKNDLFGPIPFDIGKLLALQALDLSYNQLSGSIPTSFNDLTKLEVFNVSYNEGLEGSIPQDQPQFEVLESYIGDRGLCGEPTLRACAGPPLANQPRDKRIEEKFSFLRWIDKWVSIPALCLGHFVGFLGTLALIKRWCRP